MYNYSFVCIQILGLIVTFFMCIIKFCSHLSATPITSILFLNLNLLLSNKRKITLLHSCHKHIHSFLFYMKENMVQVPAARPADLR